MKKLNLLLIVPLFSLSVLIVTCKKGQEAQSKSDDALLKSPPTTIPSLTAPTHLSEVQWKHLSVAMLNFLQNLAACNNSDFRAELINDLNSNDQEPIRLGAFYSNLSISNFSFSFRTVQNVLVWSKQCLRANELAAKKGYF